MAQSPADVPVHAFVPSLPAYRSDWKSIELPDVPDRIQREAKEWQNAAQMADWLKVRAAVGGGLADRWSELAMLFGSAGETLALACGARGEIAAWQTFRATGEPSLLSGIGMRAFTEMEAYYLLGCGHRLINVTAKLLAVDETVHDAFQSKFKTTFEPFSNAQRDWLPLNESKATALNEIAGASQHASLQMSAKPITRLVADVRWTVLTEQRHVDFHRWRPQSPGVLVHPPRSFREPTSDGGYAISVGASSHQESGELPERLAAAGTGAAQAITEAMTDFRSCWTTAVGEMLA
ncbi:MAG: hypothetical protein M3423_10380 [Actinomycetota bacterium]|nr:hypothetical protein [Actinomycetota bacterium]